MRIMVAALMAMAISPAFAASDVYVNAFVHASKFPADRVERVVSEMQQMRSIEDMIQSGVIKSAYDCLPEHRPLCYDVIHNDNKERWGFTEGGETIIQEWAEWFDATTDPKDRSDFVDKQVEEATQRGFNILTNDEIDASFIRR
jgi:hypothetical protein